MTKSSVLADILAAKADHVAQMKAQRSRADIEANFSSLDHGVAPRDFAGALTDAVADRGFGLICEVKKASPSKGVICDDFDPPRHARAYETGGAACISVLTDQPYFKGHDDHLRAVRAVVDVPVLRKDFIIDPYQIAEAREMGADCILLILAALDPAQARELEAAAHEYELQVLAEVHAIDELDAALSLKTPLIGVNNRNLKTLEVDTRTTQRVARKIGADRTVIAESGLTGHAELADLKRQGIDRFLIGESLMRADDQAAAVRALLGNKQTNAHATKVG